MKTFLPSVLSPTALVVLLLTPALFAQDEADKEKDVAPGHSFHGEAFDAGPRQKAYLMGGTGNVHLEITTDNEQVQKFFDQGVGQLHGFWYLEAERSFRHAAAMDPECAMLYWGMAMANTGNSKRAKGFIEKAVKYKAKASPREQLWIETLAGYINASDKDKKKKCRDFIRGMEKIIHEYPDEIEAKAFLAVSLWKFRRTLPIPSYETVDALIQQVFDKNPMHPAHHYKIHLWDYEKAERALPSAARCGQSAPSIAHMWHMPGHIYSRLKRYSDAVWQQEASARADHAHMIRDRVMPYEIHNYAHNNEWCTRNLIHVGRVNDALELAMNMVELPRHPKRNDPQRRGSCAAYGRARLIQVLTTYELWKETIELADTVYLEPTDREDEQIKRLRMLGAALLETGQVDAGKQQMAALDKRLNQTKAEIDKAVEEAVQKAKNSGKSDDEAKKAGEKVRKAKERSLRPLEEALDELNARLALVENRPEEALKLLPKLRGLHQSNLARLYLRAGNANKALDLAKRAHDSGQGEVYPLATYVEVLHARGETELVKPHFNRLRKLAGQADLDVPVFKQMQPIAASLGYQKEWVIPYKFPADVGQRPDLASLGPFRWTPPKAPSWQLPDENGKQHSSAEYKDRPVLLIFYLGYGCLHCVEQLGAFAPVAQQYQDAGIDIVAISTDSVDVLHKAVEASGRKEEFPFPLLSDVQLKSFKDFRAYDDFEKLPLHGTYLVDGHGKIRWQDISYEPFTEPKFLLEECKRLLAQ